MSGKALASIPRRCLIIFFSRRHKSRLTLASEEKLRDLYSAALQKAESCPAESEAPKCRYTDDMQDAIIAWDCGKLRDRFGTKLYSGSQTHQEGVQTYVIYVRQGGQSGDKITRHFRYKNANLQVWPK